MAAVDGLEVRRRVERLLEGYDPATVPAEALWAAQFDAGLAWVHFPVGHGGLGAAPELQRIVTDALDAAGAPGNFARNGIGVGMAAPVLEVWADEARALRHLRRIWTCEDIWCQMFSEPGAGSDVASLATRAERDGDEWIVNGQKVWTTLAHVARWGLLLARTDPDAPKHQGLTYFVVDMHAPGVEVRPLRQMTGEAEFNEVFFDDVRIPDAERLGEVGDGWRVAITTLMNERTVITDQSVQPRGAGVIAGALSQWPNADRGAVELDRLARSWIHAEVVRLTSIRAQQRRAAGVPGPEESVGKLAMTELARSVHELCLDLQGAGGMLSGSYEMTRPERVGEHAPGDVTRAFLRSRANTIEGGTSEVMRNILGERVLGLPGDVRVDKDVPWSQVPR